MAPPIVTYQKALYLIEPLEDRQDDRDFGFNPRGDDEKYDLIFWQSTSHPAIPTQAEIDAAEAICIANPEDEGVEELLGITPQQLQEIMPPVQPYPYVFAANDSEIPELFGGRRFYHIPSSKEYIGFQPDPGIPGEYWSDPIWDGGGYNGTCSVNRSLRRFNGQFQTYESGIPVDPGIYRILSLEACWSGYEHKPAIEILRGKYSLALADKGDNYTLRHHFDPLEDKWLFKVGNNENLWMRWRGSSSVKYPQARIQFRRVLLP